MNREFLHKNVSTRHENDVHIIKVAESSIEDVVDILDSIREPILFLDADLKVIKANRFF